MWLCGSSRKSLSLFLASFLNTDIIYLLCLGPKTVAPNSQSRVPGPEKKLFFWAASHQDWGSILSLSCSPCYFWSYCSQDSWHVDSISELCASVHFNILFVLNCGLHPSHYFTISPFSDQSEIRWNWNEPVLLIISLSSERLDYKMMECVG